MALQAYQAYLDKSTPYVPYRWIGTLALLLLFFVRIFVAQGWYIGIYDLSSERIVYDVNEKQLHTPSESTS